LRIVLTGVLMGLKTVLSSRFWIHHYLPARAAREDARPTSSEPIRTPI
jgi:hypothetical protein